LGGSGSFSPLPGVGALIGGPVGAGALVGEQRQGPEQKQIGEKQAKLQEVRRENGSTIQME